MRTRRSSAGYSGFTSRDGIGAGCAYRRPGRFFPPPERTAMCRGICRFSREWWASPTSRTACWVRTPASIESFTQATRRHTGAIVCKAWDFSLDSWHPS